MKSTQKKKILAKAVGIAGNTFNVYFRGEGTNMRNWQKQECIEKGIELIRNGTDEDFKAFIKEVECMDFSPINKKYKKFFKPSYQDVILEETDLRIITLHKTLNGFGGYENPRYIKLCDSIYRAYKGAVNTKEFRKKLLTLTSGLPRKEKTYYQRKKHSEAALKKEIDNFLKTAFRNRIISAEIRQKAKSLCSITPNVSEEVLYLANSKNLTWLHGL